MEEKPAVPVVAPVMDGPVMVSTEENNENVPGAKPDEENNLVVGAELGKAESVPVVDSSGDVQLGNSAVSTTVPELGSADPNILAANQPGVIPMAPPEENPVTLPVEPTQPVIPVGTPVVPQQPQQVIVPQPQQPAAVPTQVIPQAATNPVIPNVVRLEG